MSVKFDAARNRWRVTVSAYAAGSGAKRHRLVRYVNEPNTKAGQAEAERAEARLRLDTDEALAASTDGRLPAGSFGEFADAWYARARHPKRGPWSPKTKREVGWVLRTRIKPHLGTTPLGKVSARQIEAMYAAWEQAGYQPSTTRRWHGMVRMIFAEAKRLGELVTPNPMDRVGAAGGRAPERDIPTKAQVRAVIDATDSPAAKVFFELAAETGARRGTLVGLRWQDVDLAAGALQFVHAIAEGEDGPVLKGTKSGRAYPVTLDPDGRALAALKEHRQRAGETALALGLADRWRRGDLYVFSKDGGEHEWDVSWPSHAWRFAADKVGVGHRLHDLRHFNATNLQAAGRHPREIADRLGCTEANVQRTYSHRVPGATDREAARIMAALLA